MKHFKYSRLIFILILIYSGCLARNIKKIGEIEYFESTQFSKNFKLNNDLPRILHVNIATQTCGGAAQVVFSICLNLLKDGYAVKVVAAKNSSFHKELKRLGIPCYGVNLHWSTKQRSTFSEDLSEILNAICLQDHIDIIHAHKWWEYSSAVRVAQKINIKSVAFYHSFVLPEINKFLGFDAVMCSSPVVADYLKAENKNKNFGIKHIEFICPPHDDAKFLNFAPSFNKKDFFKVNFDIDILDCPIICMIANFYECKNHKLLFKAVRKLIYNENIPVQVMLAGAGSSAETEKFKKLVSDYGIGKNVFFLGYTSFIPELLFHSDIKVLPSKGEAFGVVLLEAAFMKKPIIVSKNSGAAGVFIKHEESGLVIDPSSVDDLVYQIKRLINNHNFMQKLGNNAYNLACSNFSSQVALLNVKHVYTELLRH